MFATALALESSKPALPGYGPPAHARELQEEAPATILPFRARPGAEPGTSGGPTSLQYPRGPVARIYRPAPSVTQAGRANARHWVLEFEPEKPLFIEPLMGWTGSDEPLRQVRVTFPTKDSAVRFARRQGYDYTVIEPQPRRVRTKGYAATLRRFGNGGRS